MGYRISTTDPAIGVDLDALTKRIATFCKNQNITTDAQWNTVVAQAFDATNAIGLGINTRAFLTEFFSKLIKIG